MRRALSANGLQKSFGGTRVLGCVDVHVDRGELVAVLGPSGSGKTTLFRCLTRLVEPDAGQIVVDGVDISRLRGAALARMRRKIGVVFQQFNLVRRISALDNALAGRLAEAPMWRVLLRRFETRDMERAADALAAVGLAGKLHQRADTLSGGQQQRVAIARALVQDSTVLLADEPVASLDPETAVAILELLRGLTRSHGLAVLCTLHQPQLADAFADRILRMEAGRLVTAAAGAPVHHVPSPAA